MRSIRIICAYALHKVCGSVVQLDSCDFMKILEITFSLAPGGAERFVVDLSNELSKTNDVTILTLKDDRVESDNRLFYKFDVSERVKYINLGLGDGVSFLNERKVYKAIKQQKPDVVHMNGAMVPTFCAWAIFMLHHKIKFFQTIHNDLRDGYDRGIVKRLFQTYGRFHWMKYICLSKTNYKDCTSFYPYSEFTWIDNGRAPLIPSEKFNEVKTEIQQYKHTPASLIVMHVARCNKQKNQELLIDAFNQLNREGIDFELLIMGAGYDNELGKSLQNKASGNNRIHFIGTRKNVSDYMLQADLFTLSSAFEGMPITLLEASLAGVPAVSTPVCGAVDIIRNGDNGYLSKDYSLSNYVKALKLAFSNISSIKENARREAKDSPYTIETCANKYMAFFEK